SGTRSAPGTAWSRRTGIHALPEAVVSAETQDALEQSQIPLPVRGAHARDAAREGQAHGQSRGAVARAERRAFSRPGGARVASGRLGGTMSSRSPAVAGRFYPATPAVLRADVSSYLVPQQERVRAIGCITPHAGYIYSGRVAGAVFSRVEIPAR